MGGPDTGRIQLHNRLLPQQDKLAVRRISNHLAVRHEGPPSNRTPIRTEKDAYTFQPLEIFPLGLLTCCPE
jgi:hypothetical protein